MKGGWTYGLAGVVGVDGVPKLIDDLYDDADNLPLRRGRFHQDIETYIHQRFGKELMRQHIA